MPAQKLREKPVAAQGLPATQGGPREAVLSSRPVPGLAAPALTWEWTRGCYSQSCCETSRSWRRCQRYPLVMTPTATTGPYVPLRTER